MRALWPFAFGAVLGGAAAYLTIGLGTGTAPEPSTLDSLSASPASPDAAAAPVVSDATAAAGMRDASELEPLSELEVMIARAAAAPEAALAELPGLSPRAGRRDVALAVLEALGNTDAALERVAAMLPELDRMSFRIDALAARAEDDPAAALQGVLTLGTGAARRLAIPGIAEVTARLDPSTALAHARLIDNRELRSLYLSSVAGTWAEVDPEAALAWVETAVLAELPAEAAADALDTVAAKDPDALLGRLDEFSPALRPVAQRSAILALAEQDPATAAAALETVNPGGNRRALEREVAEIYAFESPENALEWAKTLSDPRAALEGVFRGVAAIDYDGAVTLFMADVMNEGDPSDMMNVARTGRVINALMDSGAGDFGAVADRLLASGLPELESTIRSMMVRWPQLDAEAALDWALDNIAGDEPSLIPVPAVAASAGRDYPDLAVAALDRVPPAFRAEWIERVAAGMAVADIDRTLAFLESHRGEPGYFSGLGWVLQSLGASDPPAGAALIERVGDWDLGGHGSQFAGRWARQDPAAAASWVAGLTDTLLQMNAVTSVSLSWSSVDPDAALAWLLELSSADVRDRGLQMYLSATASRTGSLDMRALGAIGDDSRREQAAMGAIVVLGRSDPEEARRLIDEHIQDPGLRRQAERQLVQEGGGVGILTSGIDLPR